MRNTPLILALAWLVLCLAAVTLGMSVRLSPLEKEVLQPGFLGPVLWPLALVLSATAVALLWVGSGHARARHFQVPWAQLILFHPLLFAFVWLVLPAFGLTTIHLTLVVLFVAAAAFLWLKSPRLRRRPTWPRSRLLLADGAVILLPALLGLILGGRPDVKALGLSTLLYPLYAWLQLVVFLVIPARRLAAMGLPAKQAAPIIAAGFALMHAPNLLVMAVTLAAMFLWARQYLAGRRLWQLAVVMGLAATVFSQLLPDPTTGHMRVGPSYLHQVAKLELARRTQESPLNWPRPFLEYAYPLTVGRQATAEELDRWEEDLTRSLRTTRAWQFFTGNEYLRRALRHGWPLAPEIPSHWTDFPDNWRTRLEAFGSEPYWQASGGNLEGFTRSLYRDILQREPQGEEVAAWTRQLTLGQRWRLGSLLLEEGRRWHSRPYPGLDVEELRLPR